MRTLLLRELRFLRTAWRLRNRWGVISARIRGRSIPPLELAPNLSLYHEPGSDVINLLEEVMVRNCYTPHKFYRPVPGDTVIDLGANIGTFALYLQTLAKPVYVHAFEPVSATRAVLETNIKRNNLASTITAYPYAIGNTQEERDILTTGWSGHSSFFSATHLTSAVKEKVNVITLDRAIELTGATNIALLKVDIEGAEKELFRSTPPAVWARVERIAMETHDLILPGVHAEILAALGSLGFTVFAEKNSNHFVGCLGYILAVRGGK